MVEDLLPGGDEICAYVFVSDSCESVCVPSNVCELKCLCTTARLSGHKACINTMRRRHLHHCLMSMSSSDA